MSSKNVSIATRMKGYEKVNQTSLTRRMPVIVRVDGRSFHTLTRGMTRPFDHNLISIMQNTAQQMTKNIPGCSLAYVQSDEISFLLTDYKTLETQPWFDNKVQKIASVTASMATAYFNREFAKVFPEKYDKASALFDSRVFNIPREEVVNYVLWRQQDWTRNSVQMLGRSKFSAKQMLKKSNAEVQEMLWQEGINWNDLPVHLRRGACIVKEMVEDRTKYKIDLEPPIISKDRSYIQKWIDVEDLDEDPDTKKKVAGRIYPK